jgi:hypothetical protein
MRLLLALATIVLASGCRIALDSSPDAGAEVSAECVAAQGHSDLAWIETNVFTANCNFGSCHGGTGAQADHLSLIAGSVHDQLVGQPSVEDPSWMRVVASDSDHSYLMVALGAVSGPLPKDGVMPDGQTPLCQDKIDAVQRWIAAGAPDE